MRYLWLDADDLLIQGVEGGSAFPALGELYRKANNTSELKKFLSTATGSGRLREPVRFQGRHIGFAVRVHHQFQGGDAHVGLQVF